MIFTPYIEPEILAEARKLDLLSYLQTYEPQELERVCNGVYRMKSNHRLKISNGKWCDWGNNIGGASALDYLIKIRKMSLPEAVEMIAGKAAIQPPFSMPEKSERPLEFILPERFLDSKKVEEYLIERGIDHEIIRHCIDAGRIFESHHNRYVNAVFVGFDKSGVSRYAAMRGLSGDFKGEINGSDKRFSFSLLSKNQSDSLHLFESAIDAISYATLLKIWGKDWQGENLLSLGGAVLMKNDRLPAALEQFLTDNPHIKNLLLHLDRDKAGRAATESIIKALPTGYSARDSPPPSGKDVNAYLCQIRQRSERSRER